MAQKVAGTPASVAPSVATVQTAPFGASTRIGLGPKRSLDEVYHMQLSQARAQYLNNPYATRNQEGAKKVLANLQQVFPSQLRLSGEKTILRQSNSKPTGVASTANLADTNSALNPVANAMLTNKIIAKPFVSSVSSAMNAKMAEMTMAQTPFTGQLNVPAPVVPGMPQLNVGVNSALPKVGLARMYEVPQFQQSALSAPNALADAAAGQAPVKIENNIDLTNVNNALGKLQLATETNFEQAKSVLNLQSAFGPRPEINLAAPQIMVPGAHGFSAAAPSPPCGSPVAVFPENMSKGSALNDLPPEMTEDEEPEAVTPPPPKDRVEAAETREEGKLGQFVQAKAE
jgi:hypothetical protein